MPVRRLKKEQAHLEITAFINLIVVLVPFLLSVSVFTHLAVIDLSLPAQQNEKLEKLTDNNQAPPYPTNSASTTAVIELMAAPNSAASRSISTNAPPTPGPKT